MFNKKTNKQPSVIKGEAIKVATLPQVVFIPGNRSITVRGPSLNESHHWHCHLDGCLQCRHHHCFPFLYLLSLPAFISVCPHSSHSKAKQNIKSKQDRHDMKADHIMVNKPRGSSLQTALLCLKKSKIPPKVLDLSIVALHIMMLKECPIFVFVCQRNKFPFFLISFFAFLKALPFKNFQKCHGTYCTWDIPRSSDPTSWGWSYVPFRRIWIHLNPKSSELRCFFSAHHPPENTMFFWKNPLLLKNHLEWHHLTSQICQTSVLEISEVHRLTLIFIEELDLKKTFRKEKKRLHQLSLRRISVNKHDGYVDKLVCFRELIQIQQRRNTKWYHLLPTGKKESSRNFIHSIWYLIFNNLDFFVEKSPKTRWFKVTSNYPLVGGHDSPFKGSRLSHPKEHQQNCQEKPTVAL